MSIIIHTNPDPLFTLRWITNQNLRSPTEPSITDCRATALCIFKKMMAMFVK